MQLELTKEEAWALSWLLNDYVRSTIYISAEADEEGVHHVSCGGCLREAKSRGEIQHTPDCGEPALWALYDKVERLETEFEVASLESSSRD